MRKGLSNINDGGRYTIDKAHYPVIDPSFYGSEQFPWKSSYQETGRSNNENFRGTVHHYYPPPKYKSKYFDFMETRFNGFDDNGKIIWGTK